MVKKALFLKGLVAQDCTIVYSTCDMFNWLVPAAGAHVVIGKTFTSEEQFQWTWRIKVEMKINNYSLVDPSREVSEIEFREK